MAKIGEYFVELSARGASQVSSAVASVQKQFQSFASASLAPIRTIGSALTGLLSPCTALTSALGAMGASLSAGAMVRLAADAEQMQAAFEVLLGSADRARQMVEDLKRFAAATPFEMPGLAQAAKTLLQFGRSADQAMADLQMLSNVAMGDQAKLLSLATVFGQISSAGRLTGGDLLQLINAGFNPLLIISQKTGLSIGQLRELMEKGAISFEHVRWAFEAATSAGGQFYQMNEKMSATLGGLWSTAADAVKNTLTALGQAIVDTFDLKGVVSNLSAFVEQYRGALVEGLSNVMGQLKEYLTPLWEGLASAVGAAVAWIRAHWESLVGAAQGLMAVLAGLWSYVQAFVGVLLAVISPIVDLIGWLGQWLSRNQELVAAIGTAIGVVAAAAAAINVLMASTVALQAVLGALLSPIGLVAAAIAALGLLFPDTFRKAIAAVKEFAANWDIYLPLMWENTKLSLSNLWEHIKAFFTNAGILVSWLARNWTNVWITIWRAATTIFSNLIKNLKELWSAFWNFLKTGRWTFDWTPMLDGFKSAIEEMPELVSANVRETTPAIERLTEELAKRKAEAEAEGRREPTAAQPAAGAAAAPATAAPLPPMPGLPALEKEEKKEPKPKAAPTPKVAAGAEPKISFVALEALAQQMQEEAGRREQEQIAQNTEKTAEATEKLASAVEGGALRVRLETPAPAVYS